MPKKNAELLQQQILRDNYKQLVLLYLFFLLIDYLLPFIGTVAIVCSEGDIGAGRSSWV